MQPVTSALKPKLGTLIDSIQAGSCTNLSGGLFKGLQQLQEWKEPDVAVGEFHSCFVDGTHMSDQCAKAYAEYSMNTADRLMVCEPPAA